MIKAGDRVVLARPGDKLTHQDVRGEEGTVELITYDRRGTLVTVNFPSRTMQVFARRLELVEEQS